MRVELRQTGRFERVEADSCSQNSKLHWMILNRPTRDLNVVKWDGVIAELLIIFVSLARDHNNVARPGERNSAIDRLGAINDFFIAIRTKSFFDLRDDRIWIFLARIIG